MIDREDPWKSNSQNSEYNKISVEQKLLVAI